MLRSSMVQPLRGDLADGQDPVRHSEPHLIPREPHPIHPAGVVLIGGAGVAGQDTGQRRPLLGR